MRGKNPIARCRAMMNLREHLTSRNDMERPTRNDNVLNSVRRQNRMETVERSPLGTVVVPQWGLGKFPTEWLETDVRARRRRLSVKKASSGVHSSHYIPCLPCGLRRNISNANISPVISNPLVPFFFLLCPLSFLPSHFLFSRLLKHISSSQERLQHTQCGDPPPSTSSSIVYEDFFPLPSQAEEYLKRRNISRGKIRSPRGPVETSNASMNHPFPPYFPSSLVSQIRL